MNISWTGNIALTMLPEIIVLITGLLILIIDLIARRARIPTVTQGAFVPLAPTLEQMDLISHMPARAAAVAARPEQRRGLGMFAIAGLALAALATIPAATVALTTGYRPDPNNVLTLFYISDPFRLVFVWAFLGMTALTIMLSLDRPWSYPAEYYAILLFSTLGMMFVAAAGELITLYISLELLSISQYILASYAKGDTRSNEAGLKYLIIGALSSAILLYGIALLYGITGTTILSGAEGIPGIAQIMPQLLNQQSQLYLPGSHALMLLTTVFLLAGFGFKIATVPFHTWTPDVYEGAPTQITAFLSVASKAAGFAIILRIFVASGAMDALYTSWQPIVAILAVATMTLGNLAAIGQRNAKRMLAYSSIAQAGYVLIGVVSQRPGDPNSVGMITAILYLIIYAFTNLAVFGVIIAYGKEEIADFAGLSRRAPGTALMMTLGLLSLAGIPPLAGFFGKFFLFYAAVQSGLVWLVVIGVLNSAVSLYYYLRIIKEMYVGQPASEEQLPQSWSLGSALLLTTVGTTILGFLSGPLLSLLQSVAQTVASVVH